jgi:hypothetical protein
LPDPDGNDGILGDTVGLVDDTQGKNGWKQHIKRWFAAKKSKREPDTKPGKVSVRI